VGFPIRKSTDQRVFAPPRSLSQRITSFIACACQGIHQSPLRHLIIHIANAHPSAIRRIVASNEPGRKDQLLEICPVAAVKGPIMCRRLSVSGDVAASIDTRPLTEGYGPSRTRLRMRNPNKSSLHDVTQNRRQAEAGRKLFSLTDDLAHKSRRPAIRSSRRSEGWWSRTGSNRRPPACKAGALPAELRPHLSAYPNRTPRSRRLRKADRPSRLMPRPVRSQPEGRTA
jgi:hypothetical protein